MVQLMFLRLIFVFFISCNAWGQYSYIDYPSPYHPTITQNGMVVSQNSDSSTIGIDILNRGGNAIDAAVAVGFSLNTTLPRAGAIGGGGFMLVYIKERDKLFAIDYRSQSSLNTDLKTLFKVDLPEDYKKANFDQVKYGYKASNIPGTVSGLLKVHKEFGRLPLAEILKPVIEQAREGILVSYDLQKAIESTSQLLDDPESKRIYYNNGEALKEGSVMKRPDLANTIQSISNNGLDGFYKGKIAQKIVDAMTLNNGFIDHKDMQNYDARFTDPISINYRKHKVYTHGPPSGGGIVLLTALNLLEAFDLKKYQSNTTRTYHLLAEALRRGHNNRSHHIGDPSFYDVPMDKLLSKKRIKELIKGMTLKKASPASKVKPLRVKEEGKDTTHYSIIDEDGNAVSNTFTLGYSFGSGVTIPGAGVLMNNQMNNFAYRYGDPSIQGRSASPGNQFKPGKRPMSTMAPTMIFDDQAQLTLITGSPGGSFIPDAILRVVTGVIDFGLNIGEATMLPRLHKDWPYSGLDHESTVSSDILKALTKLGHRTELSKTMGSTQSIHIINQTNYGYADLRRPGASVAIQKNHQ